LSASGAGEAAPEPEEESQKGITEERSGVPEAPAALESWLGRAPDGLALRPLSGGHVYSVPEATFNGPESPVVFKVAGRVEEEGLRKEARTLD
jgi:hypothetical protein